MAPSGDFQQRATHAGHFEGYVFKTSDKGTGYHSTNGTTEGSSALPTADASDLYVAAHVGTDEELYRVTRARRARNKNGGRSKPASRAMKQLAAAAVPVFLATGMLPDRWWKDKGLWGVDTAHTNCVDQRTTK